MARKPVHFSPYTSQELDVRFEHALKILGQKAHPRGAAVNDVIVDGIRFGDRRKEFRKPNSSFYSQSYIEALSVAGLCVDLGLAPVVADVRRREPPYPDIEVYLKDGGSIFIEQTIVMDPEAHLFSLTIDDVNSLVRRSADEDKMLERALQSGSMNIRLDRLTDSQISKTWSPFELAAEVCNLARSLIGHAERIIRARPSETMLPLLHELGATLFYTPGMRTGSVMQLPMDHGRHEMFEPALRRQIENKIARGAMYHSNSRPLWLTIDIDRHFAMVARREAIVRAVLESVGPNEFDRIVVQHVGAPPMLFETC